MVMREEVRMMEWKRGTRTRSGTKEVIMGLINARRVAQERKRERERER